MDLTRTLKVEIDPRPAEAGGARATKAFKGVGESAKRMAESEDRATKSGQRTGQTMQQNARLSDILRQTLDRQNSILVKLDSTVNRLSAALARNRNSMDGVESSTRRAAASMRKASDEGRRMATASDASAASTRRASAAGEAFGGTLVRVANRARIATHEIRALVAATMALAVGFPSAPAIAGGGGRNIINVTGTAGPAGGILALPGPMGRSVRPPPLPRGGGGGGGASWLNAGMMRGALGPLGVVGGAAGVTMAGINLGSTEMQLQRNANALKFASENAADLARNQLLVRDASKALGLELLSTEREFAKFMAAGKGTEFTGDELREVFLGIAKAGTVLGLSAEEMGGTLNALQQMISKGKVQAEELRGQLGERLPGAFNMAARAMGVTTQQLDKMLERGEVTAHDLLPALAKELEKTFGSSAVEASKSLNAEFNRMRTAFVEFKAELLDAGLADAITGLVKGLSEVLGVMKELVQSAREFHQWLADLEPKWMKWTRENVSPVGMARRVWQFGSKIRRSISGDPAAESRQDAILNPSTGPSEKPIEMAPYKVTPSPLENFRAGLGSYGYEFDKETKSWTYTFENSMQRMVKAGEDAIGVLDSGFQGFFDTLIDNPKKAGEAFKEMTASILRDIAKIIMRQMVVLPLLNAITGAFGIKPAVGVPSTATTTVPVGHSGFRVGSASTQFRSVSPSLFIGAPRFHNGLAPDEFPAILQAGEEVIPRHRAGRTSNGPVVVNLTVNVDGSNAGTPEQNKEFGAEVARQMQGMVQAEIARALQPRGIIGRAMR